MKVLVVNCGSSSLKYQVLDMETETLMAKGLVERIGMDGSVITHEKIGMDKVKNEVPMKDHKDAIKQVLEAVQNPEYGVVASMDEIGAVGHRVVHAGDRRCCYRRSGGMRGTGSAAQYTEFIRYRGVQGTDAGHTDGRRIRYSVPSDHAA